VGYFETLIEMDRQQKMAQKSEKVDEK